MMTSYASSFEYIKFSEVEGYFGDEPEFALKARKPVPKKFDIRGVDGYLADAKEGAPSFSIFAADSRGVERIMLGPASFANHQANPNARYICETKSQTKNRIGIRHPVFCNDGYVFEEKCIKEWIESGKSSSPLTRQVIESVKECNITDECLNEMENSIEDEYDRTNFLFSKEEAIVQYYIDVIENEEEIGVIFGGRIVLELVKRNGYALKYASDVLKNIRNFYGSC